MNKPHPTLVDAFSLTANAWSSLSLRFRRLLYRRSVRLFLIWLSLAAGAVAYVWLASWWGSRDRWTQFEDLLIPRTVDLFIGGWFFFVGSSIGSFLNVVAYRMPLGMSVNGRSHCPRCRQELSWKDNWPVLGWLALGGRCRTCHLPISPRYPIVEAVVGLCIFMVAWLQFSYPGYVIPYWPTLHGHVGVLYSAPLTLPAVAVMVYHAAVLGCVWALGLVRWDANRLPANLMTSTLLLAIVPMLIYPALMVVPWQQEAANWSAQGRYLDALMRILSSVVTAIFIGRALAGALAPTADPKLNPLGEGTKALIDLIWIVALPAIVIGWQSIIGLSTIAQYGILGWLVIRKRQPAKESGADSIGKTQEIQLLSIFAVYLPVLLTVHLCLWRPLIDFSWWPSVQSSPAVILVWGAAHLCATWMLIKFNQPVASVTSPEQREPQLESPAIDDFE